MTTPKKTVLQTLALFLPGIFLLGFNIGTGSVTTMAAAGADYGMSLLWTIAASCVATYFMIVIYGKYTLVTGGDEMKAVSEGDRFFVPHQTDAVTFESETGIEIVTTFPPK